MTFVESILSMRHTRWVMAGWMV